MRVQIVCLLFALSAGCRTGGSSSETKDLPDMVATTNNNDGTYTVACKDGTSYKLSQDDLRAQIANGTICSGGGASGAVFCLPYSSNNAQVARLSDNKVLGGDASFTDCSKLIHAAKNGIACAFYSSSSAQIYRVMDATVLASGDDVPFDACADLTRDSSAKVACVPYSSETATVTRISDGKRLGDDVPFETCRKLSRAATATKTCAAYSSASAQIFDIASGAGIGETVSFDACISLLHP